MKSIWLWSVIFLLFSPGLHGQEKRDYIWIFADDDHPNDNMGEGVIMDFNTMPVIPEFLDKEMQIKFTGAVISSTEGELQFYTNGCYIANHTHEMMENGDGLNPGLGYDLNCTVGGYTVVQGALILPIPQSDGEYLLFHTQLKVVSNPTDLLPFLLYTQVDMAANAGLGNVLEKNRPVLSDTLDYGRLTAVKHANDTDWWIVVAERYSNRHYRILLTSQGITNIQEQKIGLPSIPGGQGGGMAVFSPNGDKFIKYDPVDDVHIFDFDRSTGLLSNFVHISIQDSAFAGGCAVSPNSRFLYITSEWDLYQFDLQADDIGTSQVHIAHWDGFTSPFPALFTRPQLAPDCKIYIASSGDVDYLHVINNPDEKGLACNFQQHSVKLPVVNSKVIPFFPNFNLGIGPPCEGMSSGFSIGVPGSVIEIYPSPASDHLNIKLPTYNGEKGHIELRNLDGALIHSVVLEDRITRIALDSNLPNGVYSVNVLAGELNYGHKVVIMNK